MIRNPQREILAYLLAGGRLTVQKAIQMFDTTELRRIVSRLKDRGFPVVADKQYGETKTGRQVQARLRAVAADGEKYPAVWNHSRHYLT